MKITLSDGLKKILEIEIDKDTANFVHNVWGFEEIVSRWDSEFIQQAVNQIVKDPVEAQLIGGKLNAYFLIFRNLLVAKIEKHKEDLLKRFASLTDTTASLQFSLEDYKDMEHIFQHILMSDYIPLYNSAIIERLLEKVQGFITYKKKIKELENAKKEKKKTSAND